MSVTLYILEFVLCSAVFVALYKLFIEGRVSYRYSRIYLVLSMVFSAVVPMLELPLYPAQTIYYELPIITYEQPVEILPSADIVSPSEPMPEPEQQPIDWGKVAGIVAASIYGLIVMLNLARFAWRLWLIRKLRRRCELTIYEAYTLALSDHISEPFSFWRTVYMNRHLQGRERQHILTHELSHVSHHHTAERLTLELMRCVFWFNPFVWIAGSLLVQVQEWQADKDVIDAGYDVYEYRNFIFRQLYGVGPEVDLTSGLHSKLTKKRFLMMTDFKKGRFQLLRMVASVPVMAAMILAFGAVKAEDKIVYSNPSQSVESELATDQMENDAVVQDTTKTKSSVQIKFSTGVIPPEPQEKRIILNRGTYEVMSCAFTSAQYNKISPNVVITVLNDTEMEIKSQGDWKLVESGRYSYMLTPKRLSLTSADGKYTFDAKFAGPMFKSTLKLHTPNDAKISRLDFVGPKETRDSTVAIGFKDGNVYLNGKQTTLKELDEVHHFDFDAEAQDENGKPTTLLDILRKGTNKPIRQEAVADSDVASVELSPKAQKAARKAAEQPRPIIKMFSNVDTKSVDIFLEGEPITIPEFQKIISAGNMANKTFVLTANTTYLLRGSQYVLDMQKIIKQCGAKYELGKSLTVVGGKRGQRVGPAYVYEPDGKLYTELNDEVRAILKGADISEREFLESNHLLNIKLKSEFRILVCKFGVYFNEARYYNMKMFKDDLALLKENNIMSPTKFYIQEGAAEDKVAEVKDILSSLDLLGYIPVEHTTTYGFKEMPIILIDYELATPEQLAKLSPDEISMFYMETQMQPHTPRLLQLTPYTEADFEKRKLIRVEYKASVQARDGKLYLNDKEISVAEYVKLNKGYYSDKNIAHAKSFSDEQKVIWIHNALLQSPSTMVHRISQGGDPKACKNLASSKLSEQAVIYLSNGYNVEVAEAVKEALMDNRRVKVISIVDSEGKGEVICKDVDGQMVTLKCNSKHRMSKPTYDKIVATISGEDLLLVDGFKMNQAEFRRHISEYGEYRTKIRIITDSAKGMTKEQVMAMAEQLRDELIMSNVVKDVKFVTRKTAETESAPVDLEKCAKSGDITVGDYFSYGVMTKDEPVWDPNKIPQPKIRQILQMVPVINVADDDTLYVLNRTPKNIIESGKYKYTYANGVLTLKGDKEYQFPYELEYIPGKYETLLLKLRLDKKINDVEVEMISLSL